MAKRKIQILVIYFYDQRNSLLLLFLFCFFLILSKQFQPAKQEFSFQEEKKSKQIVMTTAEVLSECVCDDRFIVIRLLWERMLF